MASSSSSYYGGRKAQALRRELMRTSDWLCVICGELIEHEDEFTVEHPHARSHGGEPYDRENVGPAHAHCNYSRGNRTPRFHPATIPPPSREW